MIVIAGPPGSGKSKLFPVAAFGVDFFNADDRAAELNGGSYMRIPSELRQEVNREFEDFIATHILGRKSFAFETTLRSEITFDQAQAARAAGFEVEMRYVALNDFAMNLQRACQ
jgi:predicted ABC-type ATPase